MSNAHKYKIEAFWDQEAEVWVTQSDDVIGLVTEASTLDELSLKLKQMIPELLFANQILSPETRQKITFEVITRREEYINVA